MGVELIHPDRQTDTTGPTTTNSTAITKLRQ